MITTTEQQEFTLTVDQQRIVDLIENSDDNFLIHGKPGVGKSVLIRALRTTGKKYYTLGAPTGLAATNIGGKTLHALFGIPVSDGILEPDFNRFTTNTNVTNYIQHRIKHLIIDEISMVRVDVLDYVDRVLKYVKGNDLPFGGVQVIAVGDFFQLPPVVNAADRKALERVGYRSEFAFDAKCFSSFKPVILNEVLRQNDEVFIGILHAARTGRISNTQIAKLNTRVESCTDFRIKLTGTNRQADTVNQANLAAIGSPIYESQAKCFGTWPAYPVEQVLQLKIGAQVLIKKNSADKPPRVQGERATPFTSKVVNGTIGIIEELPNTEDEVKKVMVRLQDDSIVPIYWARWERKEKERTEEGWTEKILASYEQFPLQLAWAISMHKSQGQSFTNVHIDASQIFAAGQLYVALSRARSLEGLSLQVPVTGQKFWASHRVLQFTKQIELNQI